MKNRIMKGTTLVDGDQACRPRLDCGTINNFRTLNVFMAWLSRWDVFGFGPMAKYLFYV